MKNSNEVILVTKPNLPPRRDFEKYCDQIWANQWLTNNGPLVRELEKELKKFLKVKHLFFVANGTLALQIAIKVLGLRGEIITTPFSFAASTTAILWENCVPVFADIAKQDFGLDPVALEKRITKKTQAILAVHVYGYPCQVQKIEQIARKYQLKVIYDGAHAFGTEINGKSVFRYGDISTVSFHATKLFHTVEGGAVITNDDELAGKISLARSFGFVNDEYYTPGINAKNSEVHAAFGLANFKKLPVIFKERKKLYAEYMENFKNLKVEVPDIPRSVKYNYAYFPVIFNSEQEMLTVKSALEREYIYPRRYFYPSLNTLPYLPKTACPVSESIAQRVLCLPFYTGLSYKNVRKIASIIRSALNSSATLREDNISFPLIKSI